MDILGCYHLFGPLNNAALNTGVQLSEAFSTTLGYISRSRIDLMTLMFNFSRNYQTVSPWFHRIKLLHQCIFMSARLQQLCFPPHLKTK